MAKLKEWVTREGVKMKPEEMADSHLEHSINYFEKIGNNTPVGHLSKALRDRLEFLYEERERRSVAGKIKKQIKEWIDS